MYVLIKEPTVSNAFVPFVRKFALNVSPFHLQEKHVLFIVSFFIIVTI